jgi:hypothetical protein
MWSLQAGPSSEGDASAVEAALGREAFDANDVDIAEANAHDRAVPPSKRAEVHAAPRPTTRAAARSSTLGRLVLSKYTYWAGKYLPTKYAILYSLSMLAHLLYLLE